MSQFNTIEDQKFYASPQIGTADIDAAAEMGVTVIINNRPDGEEVGQVTNADLAAYAAGKGIKWHHIPLMPGQLTPDHITGTAQVLSDATGPVLAFCRSGTRSSMLWGLSQAAGGMAIDEIMAKTAAGGYDFGPQRGLFEQVAGQ